MKNIKNYINTKKELELVKINLESLNDKEKYLVEFREYLKNVEQKLIVTAKEIEVKLRELDGIEQELLYNILVVGLNPTKAVDSVAYKNDKDPSTIWKGYYPKVKEKLIEVGYFSSEVPV